MNLLLAKAKWNILKGMFKQTCARLIHNDEKFFEGKAEELTGRIQMQSSRQWGKTLALDQSRSRLTSQSNTSTKAS